MSEANKTGLAPITLLMKSTSGDEIEYPLYYGDNLIAFGKTIENIKFSDGVVPENVIPVVDSDDDIVHIKLSEDGGIIIHNAEEESIHLDSDTNSFRYKNFDFFVLNMKGTNVEKGKKENNIKKYVLIIISLAFIIITSMMVLFFRHDEAKEIAQIIDEKKYGIVSIDKCNYIIAETQNDAVWASVSLKKANFNKCRKIITAATEKNKIKEYFNQRFPSVNLINLKITSASANLIVFLSKERNDLSDAEISEVKDSLIKQFPYFKGIDLIYLSDEKAKLFARGIFTKASVQYKEISANNKVTYSVMEELSDEKLELMNKMISDFKDIYGDQYIEFVIQLMDDDFKGKSYLNSKDSYVMLNDKHWFFLNKTN